VHNTEIVNLFIAFFPDRASADAIDTIVEEQSDRYRSERFRYVRPARRHCTVLFLGDFPEERCMRIRSRLIENERSLTLSASSPPLECTHVAPFPPGRRPRVLALVGNETVPDQILTLRHELARLFADLQPDVRPFRPHITLAYPRFRGAWRDEELTARPIQPVGADTRCISLMTREELYRVCAIDRA
jgi:2'-5' RNA ligase